MGLRSRLLLLVSLAAVPALLLTLWTHLEQRRAGAARVQRDAARLAQLAATKQAVLIDAAKQHLGILARFPQARSNDLRTFNAAFTGMVKAFTNYTDFGLIETNGNLVACARTNRVATNFTERACFQSAIQTRAFSIGCYVPGDAVIRSSLYCGHPVLDSDNQVVRVLYASIDATAFDAILRATQLPQGGMISVFDRRGQVLAAAPDPSRWVGLSIAGSPLWDSISKKQEGTAELKGLDGLMRLFGYSAVRDGSGSNLFVAVGVPSVQAYVETENILSANLSLLGVVAASILIVAWIYANRYILRPVRILARTTEQVAAGHLDARAKIEGTLGELSQLGRSLDAMTEKLQSQGWANEQSQKALRHSEQRFRELNTELETRVRDRTVELERAYEELEAFSYSVSHDLRAPLRPIHGYVEVLQQEARSGSLTSADSERLLNSIAEAARRMSTLIDDLLNFSRMGRVGMERVPIEMLDLVREVLSEMSNDLAGRTIQWDIHALPQVMGDPAMLKQVWTNLISNAVKYTRVRERAEIKIDGCVRDQEWEFCVGDNGVGFDMSLAPKLFDPFQRLHSRDEYEGTGIGLANVRRIVARHGGRTWAEGQVNQGASFYFTIPRTTGAPPRGPSTAEANALDASVTPPV